MSDTIDAIDNLNMAKHLFFAALMATADIDDMQERGALEAVLGEGLAKLKAGVAALETIRTLPRWRGETAGELKIVPPGT
ncbi:hypothetical protein [Mesorhizobium caraganae]|uniref:hypothetical protein n=1 Tax=Mesorhizobium caraganae TaxID=483206 RepID=UPI003ECC96C4